MRPLPRFALLTACLSVILCFLPSPSSAEAQPQVSEDQEEIIQRILELRQQIEDLLEILPEEVRQQVEQRWRERQAEATEPQPEPADESIPAAAPEVELAEPASAPPRCGGLHPFDTNQDSLISAGDRHWRFLRLWFDSNADGSLEESEIESLFALGVRQLDVALEFYIDDAGDSEDVDVDDLIWLRQVGPGNSNRRSGALVVDADRLVRDGRLWLVDPNGNRLSGLQPLDSDTLLETNEGLQSALFCQEFE